MEIRISNSVAGSGLREKKKKKKMSVSFLIGKKPEISGLLFKSRQFSVLNYNFTLSAQIFITGQ